MSTLFPLRFAWCPVVADDGRLLHLLAPILISILQPALLACNGLSAPGGTARRVLRVTTRSPGMDNGGTAISGFFTSADSDLHKS